MKHVIPECYKNFVCTADACRKNCCSDGWDIEVDHDTLELYSRLEKDVSGPLFSALREVDGVCCFKTSGGSCIWLDEKGLCGIYREYGPEYQSDVCRLFPRFSEYFGDVKESGIGLGCEKAARIIFSEDDPFELFEEELDEEACWDDEYDPEIADLVMGLRKDLMKTVLDRDTPCTEKMLAILDRCHQMQAELNSGSEKIRENTGDISLYKALGRIYESLDNFPDKRPELEAALMRMNKLLEKADEGIFKESLINLGKSHRDEDYGRFLAYMLYRYLGKAVFDRNIEDKAKLIVVFLIILRMQDAVFFTENDEMTLDDRINIAEMISREIEYSADSMECLYEDLIFEDVYRYEDLRNLIIMLGD